MYLTGNKQEWAKIYALFRLMEKQGFMRGNRSLEAKENSFLSLRRLQRTLPNGIITLLPDENGWRFILETTDENGENPTTVENSIPSVRFAQNADLLYQLLQGKNDTITCDEAETLLEEMGIYDYYSASEEGDDFQAVFFDSQINCEVFHKIRVRSLIDNCYLVAANRASNFKFDITQVKFSNPESNKINAIGDNETGSIHRLDEIFRLGGKLKFTSTEGKFFLNGLQLIDMQLPKLLSEMVRLFYTTEKITVRDLVDELNYINLFKVKEELITKSRIYEYKVRQFLYAAACGMKPTKTWRGNGNAHLQLFVTKEGTLLGYDPVQKEEFEKFLLANTRLSLPNEDRNKFGVIEKENGQWLIKLNLEIRFI
ncbi:MAG: HpaII family restriction endonuclease [Bacteroidales bacterium]